MRPLASEDANSSLAAKKLHIRFLFTFIVVLLLAIGLAAPVQADPDRVTKGEAEALLQTWSNARIVVSSNGVTQPVIFETPLDAAILPFFTDGFHYCVLDWHLVLLSWISGGDQSYTHQDAVADLGPIENHFVLDGVPLETQRTPIKRRLVNTFGFDRAYAFQEGAVLAAEALAVGAHTLAWEGGVPGEIETNSITFHIDPADSETCQ